MKQAQLVTPAILKFIMLLHLVHTQFETIRVTIPKRCLALRVVPINFPSREIYTPEFSNMTMKKQPFENVSPFKNCDFPASHVSLLEGNSFFSQSYS